MIEPRPRTSDDEAATRVYPDMPVYTGTEAEFLAAIELGIADLDAGRTVPFDDVASELRRVYARR